MKNKTDIQIGNKLYTESDQRKFPIPEALQKVTLQNKSLSH